MRRALERGARTGALALLLWMLLSSLRPGTAVPAALDSPATREALLGATAGGIPDRLHLRASGTPDPVVRVWAGAASRAGASVTWSGEGLVPTALAAAPVPDPWGGVQVRALAEGASVLALSDEAGLIDSLPLTGGAASVALRGAVGTLFAGTTDRPAVVRVPDEEGPGTVLVLGAAGWETRFLVTALEERGWDVAARLAVAPGVAITQGEPAALDTARHAAVVVVDSTAAAAAARIIRFVRQGGGLVLVGSAATIPALRALAPGVPGPHIAAASGNPPDSAPRGALGAHPIARLTSDAVPLERRSAHVMAAARRIGAGRVVQVAYDDSWRWRMGGGDDAVEAHREWWSRVIAGVAYVRQTPPAPLPRTDTLDPAPYTRFVATLGPASAPPAFPVDAAALSPGWALLAVLVLLLGEWSSRRLRGAR